MQTPEGKLKKYVSKRLKEIGCYQFMYVPSGYGKQTIDYLVCLRGKFIGIETKAPGKEPTKRQYDCMDEIKAAGGIAFACDSVEAFEMAMQENGLLPGEARHLEAAAAEVE